MNAGRSIGHLPRWAISLHGRHGMPNPSKALQHLRLRDGGLHNALQNVQCRYITTQQLDVDRVGRERVVILGSGWAGYTLSRRLDPRKFQVVIVSPRSYFVFTPLLASTSAGTLEFRTAMEPLRRRRAKNHYIQGWADDVNFETKSLSIEAAVVDPNQSLAPVMAERTDRSKRKGGLFNLNYDKLVIAVGCYSQTFGIEGVKEHANFLKDVGDARKIRKKLLECFEAAALPITPEKVRKELLNFAIVGGGPTGIEFAAELHDLIREDISKDYPNLAPLCRVTVYDVAPKVLSAFDENLAKYAMETFKREGIDIKLQRVIKGLSSGLPGSKSDGSQPGLTISIKGEGEVGAGICVWSTGLMMNPFVMNVLKNKEHFARKDILPSKQEAGEGTGWKIVTDEKTNSLLTNDRLRVMLRGQNRQGEPIRGFTKDVFAIGDCAIVEGTHYPTTAQVASQKADWLGKRLNSNDLQNQRFAWRNLGVMAYLGNWRAVVGGGGYGNISGRTAWIIWRGAYLVKSVSWRNRILIPIYWFLNWAFGRDLSRF